MLRIGIDAEGPFGPSATWSSVARVAAVPAVAAAAVVGLGEVHGGFAPTAWGWTAVPVLWLVVLLVVFRERISLTRGGIGFGALALSFFAWTAASSGWSASVPRTMFEVERDLVYAGCIALVLLAPAADVRRATTGLVAGVVALVASAVAVYVVATPAFDATQGYLLFRPLGYANALGLLAVLALPPTLAHVDGVRLAAPAGVVLFAALFLTHNRSAWLALGCALVVWLLRTREPQVAAASLGVVVLPAGAAIAAVAALGVQTRTHRLLDGAAIAGCAAAAAFAARPRVGGATARRAASAGAIVVAVGAVASLTQLGDREHYWRAAWQGFRAHPVAGGGAGTFELDWFRYRDVALTVRDAHNLYLATLAELGVVGLVLLVALLVTPLVCARRVRDPRLCALLASYCAFLVHAAFEWDWKFPLVTGVGLVFGAALVVTSAPATLRLRGDARAAGAVAAVATALFALATLAGNTRVASAEARLAAGDAAPAAADADAARRFLPWASEPWLVLAEASLRGGDEPGARSALRAASTRDGADWTVWVRLATVTGGAERVAAIRDALALNPLLVARARRK